MIADADWRAPCSPSVVYSLITVMRHLLLLALGVLSVTSSVTRADELGTTAFARLGPIVMHGNEADNLMLGLGAFGLRGGTSPAGTIEYRFGRKVFIIGPTLGLVANTDRGLFGYVGAYGDLSYKRLYLTPQMAMGGYHEGGGPDLGGVFQFRLSLDFTWRFQNGHRVGIRAAHISNANIHDHNPGEEELLLTYSLPLGPYL
jgi:lipid A 3-O-deacylase